MKYTFTVAALVALVATQGISDLPSCSLSCLITGIGATGCSTTDFACSCQKANVLTPSITPCVAAACSNTADQAKVMEVLSGICASAGYPIGGAASSGASASASVTSVASSVVPASSLDSIVSSFDLTPSQSPTATGSVVASASGSATPSGSVTASGSATASVSASASEFTGAAAATKVPAAVAGMLGLAAFIF